MENETVVPNIYEMAKEFKKKYPLTVAWRLKKNSMIVQKFLNPGEKVKYVFVGQKNEKWYDFTSTCVVALTNQRILIGRKRVVFGYFVDSITPDMFNDLKVNSTIIWGRVIIDTINELVILSNISKKAMPELKTRVSTYIVEQKKKFPRRNKDHERHHHH